MDLCLATTRRWSESVHGSGIKVEHLVAIDAQDEDAYADYIRLSKKERWFGGSRSHQSVIVTGTRLEMGDDNVITNMPSDGDDLSGFLTAVNKVNRLASQARGRWLFFVADDFEPTSDTWIQDLKETLDQWNPMVDKIVVSPECDGRALVNHPILSRAYYEHQGWFFCPEYLHVCVDCDLHHVATLEKALHHLPVEVCAQFKHNNPYLAPNVQWDKIYGIGNNSALYAQGSRVLEARKKYLADLYADKS